MTLDRHGAGCKCLLRARENLGRAYITEARFIAERMGIYPDWRDSPGMANPERLVEIAQSLELASSGENSDDYDRTLQQFQAGHIVLVRTKAEPKSAASDSMEPEQIALVTEMDTAKLTMWAPATDGSADSITFSRHEFWTRTNACGLILCTSR
jgi:hypothetical protein